jgi:hypothetical protein
MELNSYFNDFLREIRPTDRQNDDYRQGYKTLRRRLWSGPDLKEIIVATFIQGSYRRSTAIRPQGDKRADVDLVVVTRLSQDEYTPQKAMDVFVPFLEEHYAGKYTPNARSFAIELSYVDLDLVITSAPSESQIVGLQSKAIGSQLTPDEFRELTLPDSIIRLSEAVLKAGRYWEKAASEPGWKSEPLYIPDRERKRWQRTHPLAQIEWTWGKNKATNYHYVNVVKALKWSRRIMHPDTKYPKGYPLEHIIGSCCPDGIESVAAGVVLTLEGITTRFQSEGENHQTPWLPDHGVPEHNVFARVSGDDFAAFYSQVKAAAAIARNAYDLEGAGESAEEWQKLFGSKFPSPKIRDSLKGAAITSGGYTPREKMTEIEGGRFG